jgi:predicted O-methyltransferase YrrM
MMGKRGSGGQQWACPGRRSLAGDCQQRGENRQVVALIEEILGSGTVRSADGSAVLPLDSAVDREVGDFLQRIISDKRPSVSLEVGLGYGVSALFICEAMINVGGQKHIVIDPNQTRQWRGIGVHNLREAGFSALVELHEEESQLALPSLAADGVRVDFAFIDGWHTFDHALVDFFYVDRLLRVGGIVAIDDAPFQSLHQVCRFIATNRAYRVCAVSRRGAKTRARPLARFVTWMASRSAEVRRLVKPKFSLPDEQLGFRADCRCIAFEKLADDARNWDFHREF